MKKLFKEYPDMICPDRKRSTTEGFDPEFFHIHDKYEICFVLQGRIHVSGDDADTRTAGPCVLLFKPYTMHYMSAEKGTPYIRTNLYFTGEYLDSLSKKYVDIDSIFRFSLSIYRMDRAQAERLDRLMDMATTPENDHLRYFLLGAVLKEIESLSAKLTPEVNNSKIQYISDVIRYICENYASELDTPLLAKEFFISVTKLNSDFRQYTQTTVRSFLIKVRLQNATLLLTRGTDVATAAVRCGFKNESHFIRTFKEYFKTTPYQYAMKTRTEPV